MANDVKVTFLGGLGNIGRNCAAVEVDGEIMLIDCGIMFPDSDMAGVDVVLPDFDYLVQNADRVVGVVCTHGHEDHIGAIRFLLAEMPLKIIGSELTIGLAKNRIREAKLMGRAEFIEVSDNERIQVGNFDLEFFPVTHSVPEGFATAFHTPQGAILHSGDFKLDMSPVDGRMTDLSGLGNLSSTDGVRLLLCDSTNADVEGYSASESSIGQSLRSIIKDKEGRRVIVACFASHIHRVQQVADAAIAEGRYILPLGRSMKANIDLARDLGLLHIPDSKLRSIESLEDMADGEVCVVSTGSQGEPMAALAKMAAGDNHWLNVREPDCVILSSHPIPGNETSVSNVINGLVRKGAEVIHSGQKHVHATGHAKATELRVFHSVVKPEYFVPVHGEYRHMSAHSALAAEMGVPEDNIELCVDGDSVLLTDDGLKRGEKVKADYIHVAGSVDGLGDSVLAERKILGNDGFVSVILTVDENLELHRSPEIVSRGWISGPLRDELHKKAIDRVSSALAEADAKDLIELGKVARRSLGKFINAETRLRPMVVPVVISV